MRVGMYVWLSRFVLIVLLSVSIGVAVPMVQAGSPPPLGVSTGDGSWIWEHQLPHGNDVYGLSCATDSDCRIVGDVGTVIHYDAGAWSSQSVPLSNTDALLAIECVDLSSCVAVSEAGSLWQATDTEWTEVLTAGSRLLNDISCASQHDCLAVGGAVLLHYDGTTWQEETSPVSSSLLAVDCPVVDSCFAVGPLGLIVHYDGSSWMTETTPITDTLYDIDCAAPDHCVAISDAGTALMYNGATWIAKSTGVNFLSSVSCASLSFCVAVGPFAHIAVFNGTWSVATAPEFAFYTQVDCPSLGVCFAVGLNGITHQLANGQWSALAYNISDSSLYGIDCAFAEACFAVGSFGELWQYNGTYWEDSSASVFGDLRDVECATASLCFAVGTGGTILAYNGSSWSDVVSPVSTTLYGIDCASATRCVAVGLSGKIALYTNGVWSAPASGTSSTLYGVTCDTTCFAVGAFGTIRVSDAAMTMWSPQTSNTTEDLRGVACLNASECFAVGTKRVLVAYNGTDWAVEASSQLGTMFDVECSGSECVAVGSSGVIWHYADTTWTPQRSGTSRFLYSVDCAAFCRVVGSFGALLREVLQSEALLTADTLTGTGPTLVSLSVELTTTAGLTPTGQVVFFVDGQQQAIVPIQNGVAETQVLLDVGSHVIEARYEGDGVFAARLSNQVTIVIEAGPTIYLPFIRK